MAVAIKAEAPIFLAFPHKGCSTSISQTQTSIEGNGHDTQSAFGKTIVVFEAAYLKRRGDDRAESRFEARWGRNGDRNNSHDRRSPNGEIPSTPDQKARMLRLE